MSEAKSAGWNRYRWVFHGVMLAAILVLVVLNQRNRRKPTPVPQPTSIAEYGVVPDFKLTERSGKPFQLADLRGKIWVADFIFTHCAGPCPLMTTRMAGIQKSVLGLNDVRLVSFTVDPDRDTLEVLAKYASNYGASADKWFFLTGQKAALFSLATNGFHLAAIEDSSGGSQPDHSTRFALVDREAKIRGYYDGTSEEATARLIADVKALTR
jgi:protein SCO1/2